MLYDDCEKLLDSRIVKKDDVVRSGETLAFNAYLVDIGELDGDHKPTSNLSFQERDKKITEKDGDGFFHGKKFKDNSVSVGKNKAPSSNQRPSQKIIKEFKKNEMNKYGAPRNCPDTTKTSYTEWQVLYTTQITQKAKKYHDGILRVATCGSQGRQVTLYDVNRRLLDNRFLKKDEVVGSGESLAFDGHLVDIGEPEGDHRPLLDLKGQGRICTGGGKTGLPHGQLAQHDCCVENGNSSSNNSMSPVNCHKAVNTTMREWHALYTTQITQKAKKYYSGFFRLASCGSYQMQATLLNEDGTILDRKFLKLSEDVRSGRTFELSKYLVEVGEPLIRPEGEPPKNDISGKDVESDFSCSSVDNLKLGRRIPIEKPLRDGEPPKNVLSGKEVESNFSQSSIDNFKLGRRVPIDKPLREGNEILSILRKSMSQEGSVSITSASAEQCHASQSSNIIQFDLQNQVDINLLRNSNCERSEADNQNKETTKRHNPGTLHDDLAIEIIKSANSENRGESQLRYVTPSSFSLGSGASDFSSPNCEAGGSDNSILRPVISIGEPQAKLDCTDDFQHSTASVPHDGSNRNLEGDTLGLMSSKAASSCHSNRFSDEVNIGTSPQPNEERMGIPSRQHEETFAFGIANSSGCISQDPSDIGRQSSEEYNSTSKMDEVPSFDLGF